MGRCGHTASLQIFLIVSTCFLYLVAAGLFTRAIWYFQDNAWNKIVGGDLSEVGSGAGSYDIRQSVWHVNCCNPELNGGGGWGIFNALFGWTNSATYGSVIGYNIYWLTVIVAFTSMRYYERNGHWPLLKAKAKKDSASVASDGDSDSQREGVIEETSAEKKTGGEELPPSTTVREFDV